jgi:hypothetical protein
MINMGTIRVAAHYSNCKIEWAKNYIGHVERVIKFLTSGQGKVARTEPNPLAGYHNLHIGLEIPADLPLFIGDVVHNLNSVMDYLWSGLARAVDPGLVSKVTFPRDETRDNLVSRLANPKGPDATIKKAFPDAEDFILNGVKPYKRRDDATTASEGLIWSLNKLDNINKHRLLIVLMQFIQFKKQFTATTEKGGRITFEPGVQIITGGKMNFIATDSPLKIDNETQPPLEIVFGETHFMGQPVLETLVNLVEAVTEVLKLFDKTFLR